MNTSIDKPINKSKFVAPVVEVSGWAPIVSPTVTLDVTPGHTNVVWRKNKGFITILMFPSL